jgi:PKHD-type hydroxylase
MLSLHSIPGAFSGADCDRILEIVRAEKARDARLVGQNKDHNIRRADLVWIDEVEGADWVMDRIISTVAEANREVYDFALSDFAESAQVARYGAEREGHFDWHSDIGEGPIAGRRKLTMVVQLSPPDRYTGGQLEVMPSNTIFSAPKTRGTATLFPSYLLHRVTPVTQGERFSLTIWAHGPQFR